MPNNWQVNGSNKVIGFSFIISPIIHSDVQIHVHILLHLVRKQAEQAQGIPDADPEMVKWISTRKLDI
ncbi:hypothetical protein J7E79_01685 [Bacillus sp. ISL-40]|uniref:hypothetical protein n=1 Tax=unclassified Bacillus (in: firmicutes) TaxID=185979 RepID=UPI001BE504B3|nr:MULTISPECIES: hypothetical protein [unclassified Bacillus (in: firmicutes)]MBT2696146.1 hypothetical protein [Bacillus sp. ISL-40]MBT2742993.1 hypothetical protein [Bacillus sp. ISL-77]